MSTCLESQLSLHHCPKESHDPIHLSQSDLTIVVRAKPASRPPISLMPTNGDTLGEIPYTQTILLHK